MCEMFLQILKKFGFLESSQQKEQIQTEIVCEQCLREKQRICLFSRVLFRNSNFSKIFRNISLISIFHHKLFWNFLNFFRMYLSSFCLPGCICTRAPKHRSPILCLILLGTSNMMPYYRAGVEDALSC